MQAASAKRPQDRKAVIFTTAAQLFSQQGYLGTSMRELAERIGIEAASIYSHYPSKEDLLRELAWKAAEAFDTAIEPVLADALPPGRKLHALLVAHVCCVIEQQGSAGIFLTEWRHLSEPYRTDYLNLRDRYEGHFREVLRQGVLQGQFRSLDPRFASLILLSAANMTAGWRNAEGPLSPEALGQELADLLLQGVIAPTATPPSPN